MTEDQVDGKAGTPKNPAAGGELKAIEEQTRQRVTNETTTFPPLPADGKITSLYVRQCLDCGDLGDGLLFAFLNKNQFVFNASAGDWLKFDCYWILDEKREVLSAVESTVVLTYLDELTRISEQISWAIQKKDVSQQEQLEGLRKKIIKRIDRLRSVRGREACLEFARTCGDSSLCIRGDLFDSDPWLLGCANGVIDLRTGKFAAGEPGFYISKTASPEFHGMDTPAPLWEKFVLEIMNEDPEMYYFLQRLLGYSLIGQVREHIIILFFGLGRNGKSTLIEMLRFILSDLCRPIPSEILLVSRFAKSASGPSPDIMMLKGLRIAFASETDEGNRFSMNMVKQLSGGDSLTARSPHDKHPTTFQPTHKLFLLTNWRPQANADDFGFWERLILIDFPLAFVDRAPVVKNERPAKKNLFEDLKLEASGILAWLVRGCLHYQKEGLNPPRKVKEAAAAYRQEEDLLGDFIAADCNVGEHFKEQSKLLYDRFSTWYEEEISKKNIPSQKRFSILMARRFGSAVPGERGCKYFHGIELKRV